jgi:NADPH-dependent 2,4-dienoyl-CoA reductase/sulfur reductase-like enzyme/rhodanese-related sulfurtransferase
VALQGTNIGAGEGEPPGLDGKQMKTRRLVIVGGVAAGASAAAKARRTSEQIEILLLEAGPYISFANCGLPYYVGQEIARRESLFVADAATFGQRFRVGVRTETRAVDVHPDDRRIEVETVGQGREVIEYDRLILATGAEPLEPPIPGLRRANVFTVRTVPDVDRIRAYLDPSGLDSGLGRAEPVRRALVMGGGFIGLETAEQLLGLGLEVTVVERAPQLMLSFDAEMAYPIRQALERAGAVVVTGDGLIEVVEHGSGVVARTETGREIPFDVGIMALGVRPNVELARRAGLRLGETGAVAVDGGQRSSHPDIYAAGDNCETPHLVLRRPVNIPLAGPANKMGRIAGNNATLDLIEASGDDPRRLEFHGVLGTAVVRVCDRYAAVTGITEREAKQRHIAYEVTYMVGTSHAGYYPGAESMILKILHHPQTGRLLGGQAVGGEGVDKRIDVMATAILGGLAVEDLEHLDLCYAPPVGSARDVPIMLGFAGANMRRMQMPALTPARLFEELSGSRAPLVLDVRTRREYEDAHLDGAVNVPVDELRERLDELPRDRPIVIHCHTGYRSYVAQRILLNRGWSDVRNVQGGYLLIDLTRAARAAPVLRC